jgi:hypothetical protein
MPFLFSFLSTIYSRLNFIVLMILKNKHINPRNWKKSTGTIK